MGEWLLPILCGYAVGAALGLTGSGGSLFAVPLLVYVLSLPIAVAVPTSLLVVAVTAALGAVDVLRKRMVPLRPVLVFALTGIVFAPLGLLVGAHLDEGARIGGFAVLTLVLATRMWRSAGAAEVVRAVRSRLEWGGGEPMCRYRAEGDMHLTARCALALSLAGATVGMLSGVFGVGGGFLIVPALMFVARMGVHQAIASSLVIITAVGGSGALAAGGAVLAVGATVLWFGAGSAAGMLSGRYLAPRIAGPALQRSFALMLVLVACLTLGKLTGVI